MRSTMRLLALSTLLPTLLLATSCAGPKGPFPRLADIKAVTEAKPTPSDNIADDAAAAANHNADVEGWGDRLHSAGERLCRFYKALKMPDVTFCEPPQPGG